MSTATHKAQAVKTKPRKKPAAVIVGLGILACYANSARIGGGQKTVKLDSFDAFRDTVADASAFR
jgi:hypothetical protein